MRLRCHGRLAPPSWPPMVLAWARALSAISVFDVSAAVGMITCPMTVVGAGHD